MRPRVVTRVVAREDRVGRQQRRRRLAVVVVMAMASWALVATSPPTEPVQRVEAIDRVDLSLTEDAPAGLVTFVVTASDESLWSDDEEVIPTSGTVRLEAHVPRAPATKASPSPATNPAPILGVRLLHDGVEVGGQPVRGAVLPSVVEFDLRGACVEGRDCELELEAAIEWLNPQSGETLAAELVITAAATIQGPESRPVGAELSLDVEPPETPEVAVVSDAASSAPVRLDADRPMVTWSLDLSANQAAMAQPLQWPIDSRAVLSLDIAVPEATTGQYRFREPAVRLLLIVNDEEVELRPIAGNLQHELALFTCQAGREACEEQVTLVARWDGRSPDEAVTVGWQLDAGITFHEPSAPIEGAEVRLGDPSRTDIHRDGPALSAMVEGSIPLFDDEDPVRARAIRIDIPARALSSDRVGGPMPAILAVATAWSTSSEPVPDETLIRLRTGEREDLVPFPNEPETSWFAWAAPDCRTDEPCSADFGLYASAYRQGGGFLDRTELVVHWKVEIVLVYPRGTAIPPGMEIGLVVGRP